ncbi:MAG: hypothetical protein JWN72_1808 [Thermoleophilia bacterium]|nr:hypothetical protein [Thermoleophilia bacterium]
MTPDPQHRQAAPNSPNTPRGRDGEGHARGARTRRARAGAIDPDAWVQSSDGRVAHERAAHDLAVGRVQHLEHAEFLEMFEVPLIPARIEWTVTDEFTRRYGRLRGRSHRAVGAALTAFISDLAVASPSAPPKGRPGLQLRPLAPDIAERGAWSLSWSSEGRATFVLEWTRSASGHVANVTWLAIGPHGAPDRKRWRGNA